MDLKKKLSRLSGAGAGSVAKPAPSALEPAPAPVQVDAFAPAPGDLRAGAAAPRAEGLKLQLRALEQRKAGKVETAKNTVLPFGAVEETPFGRLHVATTRFAREHRHGRAALSEAFTVRPEHVATLALEPAFAEVDFTRMLLLDTETTGLAGGTGTLPFLIGTAWFESGAGLRVEQLFLRRPGEEGPMLRRLGEQLAQATVLVTYNGKCFDWPLLRNRFVMNRLPVPTPPPHLDLLHAARRVFKRRQSGSKLTHLEQQVLGYTRVGDVPGSEIPERYFAFLRRGAAAPLVPVMEHNVLDLVALAALFGELHRQYVARGAEGESLDHLGFAEVAARASQHDAAMAFASAAAVNGSAEGWQLRAALHRKQGDAQAAASALEQALQLASAERKPEIHLQLAKLYEHRLGSPGQALEHARRSRAAETAEEHARRLERLIARAQAQSLV